MKIPNLINYTFKENFFVYKNIAILGFWKEWKTSLDFLEKVWVKKENITILDQTLSDDYLDNLWKFDLIFKTPGISPYHPKLIKHKDKFISWAQIFFNNYAWKVIWVTATKGKSTTSILIYETLKNAWYHVKLVWNIWTPILEEVDLWNPTKYDFIVYELSSYMLENLKPKCFIWIFWNIFPCHIDWHDNKFDIYKDAKLNLLKYSQNILIWFDFKNLSEKIEEKNIYTFWNDWDYRFEKNKFYINSEEILSDEWILLKWEHNKKNICAVLWICNIIKKERHNSPWIFSKLLNWLKNTITSFSWLPHRLECIWIYKWIIFIDDGISTTPESTIEAIKTFEWNIWTILLWWQDSWFTDESIKLLTYNIINSKINNIVLFPDTWSSIYKKIKKFNLNILQTNSMKEAIDFSFKYTKKWEICLLSSAAPSFSLWKSYIEKGQEFKKEIEKYV